MKQDCSKPNVPPKPKLSTPNADNSKKVSLKKARFPNATGNRGRAGLPNDGFRQHLENVIGNPSYEAQTARIRAASFRLPLNDTLSPDCHHRLAPVTVHHGASIDSDQRTLSPTAPSIPPKPSNYVKPSPEPKSADPSWVKKGQSSPTSSSLGSLNEDSVKQVSGNNYPRRVAAIVNRLENERIPLSPMRGNRNTKRYTGSVSASTPDTQPQSQLADSVSSVVGARRPSRGSWLENLARRFSADISNDDASSVFYANDSPARSTSDAGLLDSTNDSAESSSARRQVGRSTYPTNSPIHGYASLTHVTGKIDSSFSPQLLEVLPNANGAVLRSTRARTMLRRVDEGRAKLASWASWPNLDTLETKPASQLNYGRKRSLSDNFMGSNHFILQPQGLQSPPLDSWITTCSSRSSTRASFGYGSKDIGRSSVEDLPSLSGETPEERRKRKLFLAAQEVRDTEGHYVNNLRILAEEFPSCMADMPDEIPRDARESCINTGVAVKRAIYSVYELHKVILQTLNEVLDTWYSEEPNLSNVFTSEKLQYFKVASYFCNSKEDLDKQINDCQAKSVTVRHCLRTFEANHCSGLSIHSLLTVVHKRTCEYPLLLRNYAKYLPSDPTNAEVCKVEDILQQLNIILQKLNDSHGSSTSDVLNKLQRDLGSAYHLLVPGRTFCKYGVLQKHSRKQIHPRELILIKEYKEDFKKKEFAIISKERSLQFIAKTVQQKEQWVEAIRKEVKVMRHDSGIVSDVGPLNESGLPIGRQAPIWLPDSSVTSCQICLEVFTTFRRRHHCRGCGKVIDSACRGIAPLPYQNFKSSAVCPECYKILLDCALDGSDSVAKELNKYLPSGFRAPDNITDYRRRKTTTTTTQDPAVIRGPLEFAERQGAWKLVWGSLWPDRLLEIFSAEKTGPNEIGTVFELRHANQISGASLNPKSPGAAVSVERVYQFRIESMTKANEWIYCLEAAVKLD